MEKANLIKCLHYLKKVYQFARKAFGSFIKMHLVSCYAYCNVPRYLVI